MKFKVLPIITLLILGLAAAGAVVVWSTSRTPTVNPRNTPEDTEGMATTAPTNPVLSGTLTLAPVPATSPAAPHPEIAELPGSWPCFRGPQHDGIAHDAGHLARTWPASGPPVCWTIPVGDGYAAPAIYKGRVYLMDYDAVAKSDVVRCLALADGQEIWRFAYHNRVKENHGMSRTIPAVTDQYLVTLGPKCHVACFHPDSGQLLWNHDLVAEFGATVPEWYAGQCPLIDGDKVIVAPGGPDALLIAVDLATGTIAWKSPNPHAWKMTHASIMPLDPPGGGRRTYVYCASGGVAGIAADDGSILWDSAAWKVSLATVASPLVIGDGRVFFSGGYGSGSLMAKIVRDGDHYVLQTLYRLVPSVFGAVQQTPILYQDHIYGVRPNGEQGFLTCLNLDGKVLWTCPHETNFGNGPFLIADSLILAMNDTGELFLVEASSNGYKELAKAQVFQDGFESWGPMALAGGRLIVRDRTRMTCLQVGEGAK